MGDSQEKHYLSPRWSSEVMDCSLPVSFDTYSVCSFGCAYCFSQFQKALGKSGENYCRKAVCAVDVERVKRIFTLEDDSQFAPYIRQRKTLQWGGLADEFDGFERKLGKTLELLEFFKSIDYPISFSTKSTWWTRDERYMSLFRGQRNWNVKFSIITEDEGKARRIERAVPPPAERLEAIRRIAEADCGGATLRLRPFIIGVSDPTYVSLIRHAGENGATAMTTEFLCIDSRSLAKSKSNIDVLSKEAGYEIVPFYRAHSPKGRQTYLRLCRSIKKPYVETMRKTAHACGMRFYASDPDFKELSDGTCCCGLSDDWPFSRCNFAEALQIAREKGEVHWSDIAADCDFLDFSWRNAVGYNTGNSRKRGKFFFASMKDYLRYHWNTPSSASSPYKMFGYVLIPVGTDESGDVVYRFNTDV